MAAKNDVPKQGTQRKRLVLPKEEVNRGPWTLEEDEKLSRYIKEHGESRWRLVPANAGLNRCGRSCRLRWLNYLRPNIKRGNITDQEEDLIIRLHKLLGNRWSLIAGRLPGRTDNEIKNYWNTHLSKKLKLEQQHYQKDRKERSTFDSTKELVPRERVLEANQQKQRHQEPKPNFNEAKDSVVNDSNLDKLAFPDDCREYMYPSAIPSIDIDDACRSVHFEDSACLEIFDMQGLDCKENHGDDCYFDLDWLEQIWDCDTG